MIPKHTNPSVLLSSLTIVSRAALHDSDDDGEPTQADPQHAHMLARLESILKRTIEDTLPLTSQLDGSPDIDSPRKKKKRKVEKDHVDTEEKKDEEEVVIAVPFRLLSRTVQPKAIVLTPKAKPKIVSEGPAPEDTQEEAERRASRARAVAVDFAWVMNESTKPELLPPGRAKEMLHSQADVVDLKAPLLLLEKTKLTPPKPPRIVQSNPDAEVEPSPHAHDISESRCPVVQVRSYTADTGLVDKVKRRRRKPRQKPMIHARFWRPPPGLGGKALGYAWGYAGSHPLQPGESPHYTRDCMKKAEYEGA
ncbi:hypothetical protein BD309DRAFT_1016800 [Dichomitus squalens]|uniref:Uncharacterized protein n=1 Tax=Dichomitus squalens TaxID=114155 RepID=A0A4Q9Q7A6_9APHY|nr:hypothetical protein BD309DRAFT_1016800 [Dichomitus squalens]TBU63030.1 hypothetical protein BD310DRAFT_917667 [Dichomitus squalens]